MEKKEVTSHNQKGGITAYNVKIGGVKIDRSSSKSHWSMPRWVQWLVAIAGIVGAVAAILALI